MIIQEKQLQISHLFSFDRLKVKGSITALILSMMVYPSYVYAQEDSSREVISLQNQVAQLKEQISQLQAQNISLDEDSDNHHRKKHKDKENDEGTEGNNSLLPDLVSRINNLEDQQRVMRGELDDLSNQFKTQNDLINKKIDDMNFAAGRGDSSNASGNSASAASTEAVSAGTGAGLAKGLSSGKSVKSVGVGSGLSLKDGQQALLNRNFKEAESIAQKIIATPEGSKSVNARFLLAQAQAGQGNFKASSVSYYSIYKNYPKSSRAPVALLGVGYSMMKTGKTQEACQALSLLHTKYPNISDQIKSSASNLSRKAKCS